MSVMSIRDAMHSPLVHLPHLLQRRCLPLLLYSQDEPHPPQVAGTLPATAHRARGPVGWAKGGLGLAIEWEADAVTLH